MLKDIIKKGYETMSASSVSICSIVRDCQKNLNHNIRKIEKLRGYFADSEVIIFENDSKDRTLEIIKEWEQQSGNIIVRSEKYQSKTIPDSSGGVNPYFSKHRIEKMSFYRNKYLEILNTNNFKREYVIVIDLDIADFSIDGIAHSFGVNQEWNCITANGVSLSRSLRMQYHDSYALIEKGFGSIPITEKIIKDNRKKFSFLKKGMPLFAVDSAFGGLAIYKWKSLAGKYYMCIPNNDPRVQILCEHISLNNQVGGNIFINPAMMLKTRVVSLSFLIYHFKKQYKELIRKTG